ncbi:MAG: TnpV protein [Lachnospiraceae bacterium]|nr:TnpV protein [Lachnospiraceae bacterium]
MEDLKEVIVENGIEYRLRENDCYYPVISLEQKTDFSIGKYGFMRCEYIKNYKHRYYMDLLMAGKLNEHLHKVEEECYAMQERLVEQVKKKEGITEQMKVENQLLWVQRMNSINLLVEEVVVKEIVHV